MVLEIIFAFKEKKEGEHGVIRVKIYSVNKLINP
jgi:hypothetical protein